MKKPWPALRGWPVPSGIEECKTCRRTNQTGDGPEDRVHLEILDDLDGVAHAAADLFVELCAGRHRRQRHLQRRLERRINPKGS